MKKILLVTVLVFAVIIANAQKKNVFKLNFVSPVLKTYNFQYERVLGEKKSFQLGFFYTGATAGEVGLSGFGITPEYRMYLSSSKEAPKGFFLAPFVRYQSFTLKADVFDDYGDVVQGKANYSSFRPGFLIGYQWVFSDVVSLEMFLGPTYSISSVSVKSDYGTEDDFSASALSGFGVRSGMTIGIAF